MVSVEDVVVEYMVVVGEEMSCQFVAAVRTVFIVAVVDMAVEGITVEGMAVVDMAVEGITVEGMAVGDKAVVGVFFAAVAVFEGPILRSLNRSWDRPNSRLRASNRSRGSPD